MVPSAAKRLQAMSHRCMTSLRRLGPCRARGAARHRGGRVGQDHRVEAALRESRWISQAVVYGDNQPWLVALLTLDPEGPPALTAKAGCEPDFSPRVPGELEAAVDLRAALRGAA